MHDSRVDIDQIFTDGAAIDAALKRAAQEALWWHKQAGNPVSVVRDGKLIWLPAEEIDVERPEKFYGLPW